MSWRPPGCRQAPAHPTSTARPTRRACTTGSGTPPRAGPRWTASPRRRTATRALSSACLAVQGQGGDWEQAGRDHAALAGTARSCKGRAAYAVLGGLLDFHRRSPTATVRLRTPAGGAPACRYRITGVDTGGDGTARPAEVIGVELADAYFDPAELPQAATVTVGGRQVAGVPLLGPRSGGTVVLSVVVPALGPGPVDVSVRYGTDEVRLPQAFTIAPPDVLPDPEPEQEQDPATGPGTGTGTGQDEDGPAGALSFTWSGAP